MKLVNSNEEKSKYFKLIVLTEYYLYEKGKIYAFILKDAY